MVNGDQKQIEVNELNSNVYELKELEIMLIMFNPN